MLVRKRAEAGLAEILSWMLTVLLVLRGGRASVVWGGVSCERAEEERRTDCASSLKHLPSAPIGGFPLKDEKRRRGIPRLTSPEIRTENSSLGEGVEQKRYLKLSESSAPHPTRKFSPSKEAAEPARRL